MGDSPLSWRCVAGRAREPGWPGACAGRGPACSVGALRLLCPCRLTFERFWKSICGGEAFRWDAANLPGEMEGAPAGSRLAGGRPGSLRGAPVPRRGRPFPGGGARSPAGGARSPAGGAFAAGGARSSAGAPVRRQGARLPPGAPVPGRRNPLVSVAGPPPAAQTSGPLGEETAGVAGERVAWPGNGGPARGTGGLAGERVACPENGLSGGRTGGRSKQRVSGGANLIPTSEGQFGGPRKHGSVADQSGSSGAGTVGLAAEWCALPDDQAAGKKERVASPKERSRRKNKRVAWRLHGPPRKRERVAGQTNGLPGKRSTCARRKRAASLAAGWFHSWTSRWRKKRNG
jgi:hypothetical protein